MILDTVTTAGIRQHGDEWRAIEWDRHLDDSGLLLPVHAERLIDSFSGPGAKRAAIEAAGTNAVLPHMASPDADAMVNA